MAGVADDRRRVDSVQVRQRAVDAGRHAAQLRRRRPARQRLADRPALWRGARARTHRVVNRQRIANLRAERLAGRSGRCASRSVDGIFTTLGQLSLASLRGRLIEYQLRLG